MRSFHAAAGRTLSPDRDDILPLLQERQPHLVDWSAWQRLNEVETAAGTGAGRPRVKHTRIDEMLRAAAVEGKDSN